MVRIESNPDQGQKYECVGACARPRTDAVTSGHSVTKLNAVVTFKEYGRM